MPAGSSLARSNRSLCNVAADTKRTFHRKGIGPGSGLDAGPGDGGGDRKAFAHARGVGTDRGGAAAIAQVIEKNAVAAACLRRKDIVLWVAFGQRTYQPAGVAVGLIMR